MDCTMYDSTRSQIQEMMDYGNAPSSPPTEVRASQLRRSTVTRTLMPPLVRKASIRRPHASRDVYKYSSKGSPRNSIRSGSSPTKPESSYRSITYNDSPSRNRSGMYQQLVVEPKSRFNSSTKRLLRVMVAIMGVSTLSIVLSADQSTGRYLGTHSELQGKEHGVRRMLRSSLHVVEDLLSHDDDVVTFVRHTIPHKAKPHNVAVSTEKDEQDVQDRATADFGEHALAESIDGNIPSSSHERSTHAEPDIDDDMFFFSAKMD